MDRYVWVNYGCFTCEFDNVEQKYTGWSRPNPEGEEINFLTGESRSPSKATTA